MELVIKVIDSHRNIKQTYWKSLGKFYSENVWSYKGKKSEEGLRELFTTFEHEYAVKWFELTAYLGKVMVGFMRILRNPDIETDWFFCDVHTARSYRHQGIASALYNRAIELVKEYDAAETITASVSASNTNSIGLHRKLGFVDTHEYLEFANFEFEEDETAYEYRVISAYPVSAESALHKRILNKLMKAYLISEGRDSGESIKLIKKMMASYIGDSTVGFDILWNGNNPIGFEYNSPEACYKYTK